MGNKRTSRPPQRGNPHQLTIKQHVFPAASIKRFADAKGKVHVRILADGTQRREKPDSTLFCALRAWDQRAEAPFMHSIEVPFLDAAQRIIHRGSIEPTEQEVARKFFALWWARQRWRNRSLPDQALGAPAGSLAVDHSVDDREFLEKNYITSVFESGNGPTIAGHAIAGVKLQLDAMNVARHLKRNCGDAILRIAGEGEFLVPDDFGDRLFLPLTPTLQIAWLAVASRPLTRNEVAETNDYALSVAREYVFARDLSACPTRP